MAITNTLSPTLQSFDASANQIVKRVVTVTSTTPTVGDFRQGTCTDTSLNAITLPVALVLQFYFKNTHATAKLTLKWTPQGVTLVTTSVLGPGDAIMFWHTVTSVTAGFTAFSLQSDTSGATYEAFFGG